MTEQTTRTLNGLKIASLLFIGAGAVLLTGCGSASNNDQGVSFTNLGYYGIDSENACEPDTNVTNTVIGINDLTQEGPVTPSGAYICLGVQNNMSSQFVRTQRVVLSYSVAGAVQDPPTTNAAFTTILGPAQGSVQLPSEDSSVVTGSSSLPPGFTAPTSVVSGIPYLPAEVRDWMSFNKDLLPEPPFSMTVTAYVVGVTSAGDQLYTNPTDLYVEVVPSDEIIPPSEGGADDSAEVVFE